MLCSHSLSFESNKRQKPTLLSPITLAYLWTKLGKRIPRHMRRLKVLFDSGCSATLINHHLVTKLPTKRTTAQTWSTKAGTLQTNKTCHIKFSLPELHVNREIEWEVYVDNEPYESARYDMIIGRDIMESLGIDICFSSNEVKWDNASITMKDRSVFREENFQKLEQEILYQVADPETTGVEQIQSIIEAKNSQADLPAIAQGCQELQDNQEQQSLQVLQKYDSLFDGSLGCWRIDPVELELKEGATPHHAKAYPVPHSQEQNLRMKCKGW